MSGAQWIRLGSQQRQMVIEAAALVLDDPKWRYALAYKLYRGDHRRVFKAEKAGARAMAIMRAGHVQPKPIKNRRASGTGEGYRR